MPKKSKSVPDMIEGLRKEVRALGATVAVPAYVVRGDRAAMKVTGHESPWRFSLWAIKHGLKPAIKKKAHERIVYRVEDLRAACDADRAKQLQN